MAKWEQPPVSCYELMKQYLEANYSGISMACDLSQRLISLEIDSLSDSDMSILITDLKSKYPGAF